jgi:hypothetical protein
LNNKKIKKTRIDVCKINKKNPTKWKDVNLATVLFTVLIFTF